MTPAVGARFRVTVAPGGDQWADVGDIGAVVSTSEVVGMRPLWGLMETGKRAGEKEPFYLHEIEFLDAPVPEPEPVDTWVNYIRRR